ncbi:unnamed protein product [Pleuronectes platessa]|uniref:Uncharacterized protein n=1 Tax=Pleuronectes platessa TaxID=8262 RepID=A0A9N7YSV0_PLEPL|nr:unnamed protein product [Pleuronectes platessa]
MFHPVEEQDESAPIRPSRRCCHRGTSATELERPRSFTGLPEYPRDTRMQHREDYVVQKIIHAVLTDQAYLLLPKTLYLITALKKLVSIFSVLVHTLSRSLYSYQVHTAVITLMMNVTY